MDAIDNAILGHLVDEGRISFSELGRRVGLSTSAAAARVRRFERDGVIAGYRAVLGTDQPSPPTGLEVFIDVRLAPERSSQAFLDWAQAQRAVRDAVHVTGAYDYLLHVDLRDTAELDRLLRTMKSQAGAAQTLTRMALRAA